MKGNLSATSAMFAVLLALVIGIWLGKKAAT